MMGPSRRELGHGNLAERALIPSLPSQDEVRALWHMRNGIELTFSLHRSFRTPFA